MSLFTDVDTNTPLPWVNLDRIHVSFSKNVQIDIIWLSLAGVNDLQYSPTGFTYDIQTFTATWTFDTPFAADRLLLNLAGEEADPSPIDDRPGEGGQLLGGGRDFVLAFNILPGDVTGDGVTDISDLVNIASRVPASVGQAASPNYEAKYDANGDGIIDIGGPGEHGHPRTEPASRW